ncbi:hypothetical protein GGX14DRAFT_604426 [Mycena pura]|uniref:Uncharacterized protein n=1 Tax=Mycena pura TaxID=153505 RepID=A0AAD6VPW4_9AGAR|nr:hypothetical protein GGX14DRAFT_604426 [Mycena pura]
MPRPSYYATHGLPTPSIDDKTFKCPKPDCLKTISLQRAVTASLDATIPGVASRTTTDWICGISSRAAKRRLSDLEQREIRPSFCSLRPLRETWPLTSDGYSTQALRAKASALFERADTLCTGWDSRTQLLLCPVPRISPRTPSTRRSARSPVHALDSMAVAEDKPLLVAVHMLVHARARGDDPRLPARGAGRARHAHGGACVRRVCGACVRRVRVARACDAVVAQLAEGDFAFLEPVLGLCREAAAETLVHELVEATWMGHSSTGVPSTTAQSQHSTPLNTSYYHAAIPSPLFVQATGTPATPSALPIYHYDPSHHAFHK